MAGIADVWRERRRAVVLAVLVLLVSAGTAAGVTFTLMNFNPLEPAQGTLSDSALTIDSESLNYQGLNATSLTLNVSNADAGDHTGDLTVRLLNTTAGTVNLTETDTGTFAGNSNTLHTVTFSTELNVTKFDKVEVLIEETG